MHMKGFPLLLISIIIFSISSTFSQSIDADKRAVITKQLETYIDGLSPGLAIGIVQDGEVVYEHYLGYANLEHRVKINTDTRFNIASNAKQYVALSILNLVEANKLNLDDDIRQFLPEVYQDISEPITIKHLLSHTSGIRDVYDLWSLQGKTWWKLFVDNKDAIELLKKQKTLNFNPGEEYLYSNSNYILLAEIIKQVTGKSFNEYALDLFNTLDMHQTSFLVNYMEIVPHKARPYGNWNGWKEYPFVSEIHGDGALFTTLKDQLQWEKIIQNNEGANISSEIVEKSQQTIEEANTQEYGYGLMFGNYKGESYTYHDGSTGAYNATFLRFPERNTAVVLMANNGNVPTNYLAKQIADILLELKSEQGIFAAGPDKNYPALPLDKLIGAYKNEEGTIINIKLKNDSLYREIYQREPALLIQEDEMLFQYDFNSDLKMAFETEQSKVSGFTIYLSSQAPVHYQRLASFKDETSYKQSLKGVFYNDETETKIEIDYEPDSGFTITKNGKERNAELIYKDLMRMNSYEIKIVRDSSGNIEALKVKNGRIKNVIFKKL